MSHCEICGDLAQLNTCDVCGAEACGGCLHLVMYTGPDRGGSRMLCCHCIENEQENKQLPRAPGWREGG